MLLLVIGVVFSNVDGFGDVITKDGIKIQVFRRGEKKSVPKSEYLNLSHENFTYKDYGVDKLVFKEIGKPNVGYENSYNIRVYNEVNNEILLKRENIDFYFDKSYTFPIYPWIGDVGKFKIVVERNNVNILEFKFELHDFQGD
jgi:hypothetical protein